MRRLILAGGFAIAVAAAPAVAIFAGPAPSAPWNVAQDCPNGEEEDLYTGVCVPHTVPNSGAPFQAIPGNPDLPAVTLPGGGGAIPCTGHNTGQCIGLAESQAGAASATPPESTVGSEPTIHGSIG